MSVELPKLRPPSRARLVDDVCQSLEEAILTGRIKPGERLVETWLADQLDVSRTTVREALLMLERQGLVVSQPRRGTFVNRLSRQEALDVGFARALLEGYAVRVGYDRIDDDLLARMDACIAEMGNCRLPDDLPRLVQLDMSFHRMLVEVCGSRRILDLWSSLSGQIRALYITTLENQSATITYVVDFHHRLMAALRSGDARAAQEAVTRHYVRIDDGDTHVTAMNDVIGQIAPAVLTHSLDTAE